jgi:DNA-binding response OmpR family regulator
VVFRVIDGNGGGTRKVCERLSLIIVEPDPHLGFVMERWLGNSFDVELVTSGRACLDQLHRDRPQIVLAELRLPDMDARTLHGAITAEAPELSRRTMFMTAGMISDETSRFLSHLPGQIIYKPFDLSQLRAAFDALD